MKAEQVKEIKAVLNQIRPLIFKHQLTFSKYNTLPRLLNKSDLKAYTVIPDLNRVFNKYKFDEVSDLSKYIVYYGPSYFQEDLDLQPCAVLYRWFDRNLPTIGRIFKINDRLFAYTVNYRPNNSSGDTRFEGFIQDGYRLNICTKTGVDSLSVLIDQIVKHGDLYQGVISSKSRIIDPNDIIGKVSEIVDYNIYFKDDCIPRFTLFRDSLSTSIIINLLKNYVLDFIKNAEMIKDGDSFIIKSNDFTLMMTKSYLSLELKIVEVKIKTSSLDLIEQIRKMIVNRLKCKK